MAYSAGDTILDDEYNNFAGSTSDPFGINHISGTGSAQYGLGESSIATVNPGDTINASQWNALFAAMNTCASHTGISITSTSTKSAGDTIAIISALTTDLASLAAAVAGGSTGTSATTTSSVLQNPSSSSTWNNSFTTEMSVTFANANKMRHFFNAGGKIRVSSAVTGSGLAGDGGGPGMDASWTAIYAALGNLDIGSQASTRSGSGETLTTNGLANGFHDLGTGYTEIIKISDDTYPYASNNISVQAKLDAAVGSAVTITVKMVATDGTSNFTYTGGNTEGSDSQSYRNGQHQHRLSAISTTTGGGLANAHTYSSTATVSNSTS